MRILLLKGKKDKVVITIVHRLAGLAGSPDGKIKITAERSQQRFKASLLTTVPPMPPLGGHKSSSTVILISNYTLRRSVFAVGERWWHNGQRAHPEICRDPSVAGSSPATDGLPGGGFKA
ncbi:hypothetical protein PoB_006478400 [Plakobranchus ocellatus]|uniref:Uncharacterized protein n=1 Tax=Plakobranchus ocellatus TaxID=259542 RepID=A0AAV4D276_9GAST|nr:hypothetical protein PoB_006478400 [Plakobranchus ocellatus]